MPTVSNDVRGLAEEFRHDGFDVDLKENIGKGDMQRAIDAFTSKIHNGTVALFYFGGFGIEVARQNYLIPVDAQISSEADVQRDGVSTVRRIRIGDEIRGVGGPIETLTPTNHHRCGAIAKPGYEPQSWSGHLQDDSSSQLQTDQQKEEKDQTQDSSPGLAHTWVRDGSVRLIRYGSCNQRGMMTDGSGGGGDPFCVIGPHGR